MSPFDFDPIRTAEDFATYVREENEGDDVEADIARVIAAVGPEATESEWGTAWDRMVNQ